MYKSKQKALKMYIDPKTRADFLTLSEVMLDVAFLPVISRAGAQLFARC